VNDILIAVTDGLKGMAEALGAVFPATTLQDLHRAPDSQQPGLRVAGKIAKRWPAPSSRSTPRANADVALAGLDEFEDGPMGQ